MCYHLITLTAPHKLAPRFIFCLLVKGISVFMCPSVMSTSLVMCCFIRLYFLTMLLILPPRIPFQDFALCRFLLPQFICLMWWVHISLICLLCHLSLYSLTTTLPIPETIDPLDSPLIAPASLDICTSDRFEISPLKLKFWSIDEIMTLSPYLIP